MRGRASELRDFFGNDSAGDEQLWYVSRTIPEEKVPFPERFPKRSRTKGWFSRTTPEQVPKKPPKNVEEMWEAGRIYLPLVFQLSSTCLLPDQEQTGTSCEELFAGFLNLHIGIFIPIIYLCFVDKKEQIIKAAMKLLTERGVQGSPMSAIAKAANTGMGTIYNYFDTKEDLINAIYLYIKRSELHLVAKALEADLPLKMRFFNFYKAFIDFYFRNPESFAFMDQFHSSPIITEATRRAGHQDFHPVVSLIQKGQQDGLIKAMEFEALLNFLSGTITTYVRWVKTSDKENDLAMLDQHLRMVWDAIKE